MNRDEFDELIEKYETGVSTLAEEQFLIENNKKLNPTIQPWFRFIRFNKKVAPQNLKDYLWEAIQTRRIKKRRFTIGIMLAAASVILLISIYYPWNEKYNYKRKEALLSEALNMFEITDYQTQIKENFIYEDDMIKIYTALD